MIEEIARKFTDFAELHKLDGGSSDVFRAGGIVIKPIHEIQKYSWSAGTLSGISFDGIRYSMPVRSKNGNWTENGYGATRYLPGIFCRNRISEKIEAARIFHQYLKDIEKPDDSGFWNSPYDYANSFSWGGCELPVNVPEKPRGIIAELISYRKNIDLPVQLIHSDLSGNILFDNEDPLIIDFSPAYYPAEYAIAILLADSVAWHGQGTEILNFCEIDKITWVQLVLRALLFRIAVPLYFEPEDIKRFIKTRYEFIPVIDWVRSNLAANQKQEFSI
ncbi:MAG: hypothetical protein JW874_14045 [Spirochaetales bacterium]|nr:hypothetical protein [Spirochaetales bacterium]